MPVEHPFHELSHRENSRGIGLVDMAYAIRDQREERAGGQMAFQALEVMEGLLKSAKEGSYYHLKDTCKRPELLPIDFPKK